MPTLRPEKVTVMNDGVATVFLRTGVGVGAGKLGAGEMATVAGAMPAGDAAGLGGCADVSPTFAPHAAMKKRADSAQTQALDHAKPLIMAIYAGWLRAPLAAEA